MVRVSLVIISGIPGVGKTTLMEYIRDHYQLSSVVFAFEPIALWKERGWLQAFYEDPDKNGFSFQLLVFTTYVDNILSIIDQHKDKDHIVLVSERSMFDQMIFWKRQSQYADALCREAYEQVWRKWNVFLPTPKLIFFCKTADMSQTMRRVMKRSRNEEVAGLTRAYQEGLFQNHLEEYTEPTSRGGIPCQHLVLEEDDIPAYAKIVVDQIQTL